jgi:hypothetical protein
MGRCGRGWGPGRRKRLDLGALLALKKTSGSKRFVGISAPITIAFSVRDLGAAGSRRLHGWPWDFIGGHEDPRLRVVGPISRTRTQSPRCRCRPIRRHCSGLLPARQLSRQSAGTIAGTRYNAYLMGRLDSEKPKACPRQTSNASYAGSPTLTFVTLGQRNTSNVSPTVSATVTVVTF